ncbi:MAG: hypothetical protein KA954_14100 [Chitinophagales bacterium]|nr:hypothetical protein [Chitinophagales bacterium]MBP8754486.1 hypothetical protein [Chitinophagales bacterium]MBP9190096.1 hypothetical protein [Chitinophagales bacterium]MBP9549274.1 hypothetical protein [Chitinophagales bacterium]MBP9704903.1 hypothetical protein [Chitinophagales bacterium]
MNNTLLQVALKKLSKQQLKRFDDYLNSPYFNKKKTILDFWEFLNPFAPEFDIPEAEKEAAYFSVFKKPYNDSNFRNLCSDLLQLLLDYLMIENFESTEFAKQEYKLNALINLKLIDLLEKQLNSIQKQFAVSNLQYSQKLRDRLWINDYKKKLAILQNRTQLEKTSADILKITGNEQLMDFAITKSFINLINYHKATQINDEPFKYELAKKLFQIYENGLCSEDKYVNIFYMLAQLIIYHNEEYYLPLKQLITSDDAITNIADKENITIGMLAFLNEVVEKDSLRWRIEIFDIYDYRLQNNIWKIHGELAYTSFKNTIENALALNKPDYAKSILEKYAAHVHPDVQQDVTNLCTAFIAFYEKDYEKAHALLIPIQTENIMIKYELRILQSMIYFEKKEYLTLLSYIESFKHFITYNKALIETVNHVNAIKYCQHLSQLTKLKLDPEKKNFSKYKSAVESDNFLLKEWILQHLNE